MPGIALSALALLGLNAFPASDGRRPHAVRALAVLLPLAILFGHALVKFALLSTRLAAMASVATLSLSLLLALPFSGSHPAAHPTDAPIPTDALSARESEVVAMLLSGSSREDVAAALGISPSTVGTYRRRALDKLACTSLEDLASHEEPPQESPRGGIELPAAAAWGLLLGLATISAAVSKGRSSAAIVVVLLCAIVACAMALRSHRPARDRCVIALSLLAGLATGMLLRANALGQLPLWTGPLAVCFPLLATVWHSRHGNQTAPTLKLGDASIFFLATFACGLVAGPTEAGLSNVQLGGLLLRWDVLLALSAPLSAASLALLAGVLVDESLAPAEGFDPTRATHLLQAHGLSELEAKILVAIAQGQDSAVIEKSFSVARGTVNSSRARGYRALGIHSRAELIKVLGWEGAPKKD